MAEISAFTRSQTAHESTRRFFQTTELIISHLKRDFDKVKVYELTSAKNKLTNLLAASSAIHCFHYLGVKTSTDSQIVSQVSNIEAFNSTEKKEIYNEILKLTGNAIQYELDLSLLEIEYEGKIIDAMIKDREMKNENFLFDLMEQLEEHLIKSLNKYPIVYWIDHVAELSGYNQIVKSEILFETSKMKPTSIELEKQLSQQRQDEKYIELSTLNKLIEKMKIDFEFKSPRDLKLETFPIKKMLNRIINYRFNYYPISLEGLKSFRKATDLKRIIYQEMVKADQISIDYQELENEIIATISDDIIEQAQNGTTTFVYYMQNLLEISFEETIAMFQRMGIYNLPLFCHILSYDIDVFKRDIALNQLSKTDFMQLTSINNIFYKIQEKLNNLKIKSLFTSDKSLDELIESRDEIDIKTLKKTCDQVGVKYDDLINLYQKKQIVNHILSKKYPLEGPSSCYAMVLELDEIISSLSKNVYYTFFRKISQQVGRVLETYVKLKEDKGLYLLGLKRIFSTTSNEKWVSVKIEELIIKRIMDRQEELAMIFDAENNAFLINSFILARIFDCNLLEAEMMLKNESSFIYEGVKELSLPQDIVSPVSYIIAYDILNRFKDLQELRKSEREQKEESRKEELIEKHENLEKVQQLNTLNFIEKKITSTLISVSALSVNPTGLYWSEKDNQIVTDNIINHGKLTGIKICGVCGKSISGDECDEHRESTKFASVIDLFTQFYHFSMISIQANWEKIKIPSYEELYNEVHNWGYSLLSQRLNQDLRETDLNLLIEGERREIAKKIANSIGTTLDKAIYKKFKANLKKKRID